jgi:hypothetical protein
MSKILKIILWFPFISLKGAYKCACYGDEDQLLLLTLSLGIFFVNVKCSKVTGNEDLIILVSFISIMNYFSKLERENLYLQKYGELSKVIMSILHRSNKANKDIKRDIDKQIKKIGNIPRAGQQPRTVNTFNIKIGGGQKKEKELPREEKQHDIPRPNNNSKIIELGQDEYRKVDESINSIGIESNENFETEE